MDKWIKEAINNIKSEKERRGEGVKEERTVIRVIGGDKKVR